MLLKTGSLIRPRCIPAGVAISWAEARDDRTRVNRRRFGADTLFLLLMYRIASMCLVLSKIEDITDSLQQLTGDTDAWRNLNRDAAMQDLESVLDRLGECSCQVSVFLQ